MAGLKSLILAGITEGYARLMEPSVELAVIAIDEARLLGQGDEQIVAALDVALKALRGETITNEDAEALHPSLRRRLSVHLPG